MNGCARALPTIGRLDQFARALVSTIGSTYDNPPANYYRALRDPVTRGEATAQVFLGTRLQCAKCHNHPFDRWTQDDYHQWTAVFARIDYDILENGRRDKNDKHEFIGEQRVKVIDKGDVTNPRTNKPAEPRLLGVKTAARWQDTTPRRTRRYGSPRRTTSNSPAPWRTGSGTR